MGAFVGNPVQVTYTYGNDINNTVIISSQDNTVLLTNPLVSIVLYTNREYAHFGDKIQYKIVIKNIGNVVLYNNYVKFPIDSFLELIPNSVCINGKRSEVNLNHILIPDLEVGSKECTIIISTKVVKHPFCQFWKIKNKAIIHCQYDVNNYIEETSQVAETFIQKPHKSFRIKEMFKIPPQMPELNRIISCDVYLLSVCPITVYDDIVYIKVSYATEIYYRDNTKQIYNYYQTYERYLNFSQGYYPYIVGISVKEKEILENKHDIRLLIGISIYDKIASGQRK